MIGANAVRFTALLEDLREHSALSEVGAPVDLRRRWTDLWIRVQLLRRQWFRILADSSATDDPRTSVLKLNATELERDITILAQELLGETFVAGRDGALWRDRFLAAPGQTIAGGTSEIQRNLIARRILRLPSAQA
jgi:alkylation response protein AidB-like acyl-CoA dehydrogenase